MDGAITDGWARGFDPCDRYADAQHGPYRFSSPYKRVFASPPLPFLSFSHKYQLRAVLYRNVPSFVQTPTASVLYVDALNVLWLGTPRQHISTSGESKNTSPFV